MVRNQLKIRKTTLGILSRKEFVKVPTKSLGGQKRRLETVPLRTTLRTILLTLDIKTFAASATVRMLGNQEVTSATGSSKNIVLNTIQRLGDYPGIVHSRASHIPNKQMPHIP